MSLKNNTKIMTNSKKLTMTIGSILFIGFIVFITGCFNKSDNLSKGTAKEESVIDCGISKRESEKDFETDSALVCLGNALLNDCKYSEAILSTEDLGEVSFEVKKNGKECVGIMKFGNVRQIPSKELKSFANKKVECPLDFESFNSDILQSLGVKKDEKLTEAPGRLASIAYKYMIIEIIMNPETQCTVSVFDS